MLLKFLFLAAYQLGHSAKFCAKNFEKIYFPLRIYNIILSHYAWCFSPHVRISSKRKEIKQLVFLSVRPKQTGKISCSNYIIV